MWRGARLTMMCQNDLDEALIASAREGDLRSMITLLSAGANVRSRDDIALQWAVIGGYLECMRELLNAGANIHARDDEALRWAARFSHVDCVRELCIRGEFSANSIFVFVDRLIKAGMFDAIPILLAYVRFTTNEPTTR